MNDETLYVRLGGYDAISAVVNNLLPRVREDPQLARYWQHSADDRLRRSKQLLIDFLCSNTGGPLYYAGRDMKVTHRGMNISGQDWLVFMKHLHATLAFFNVPQRECGELIAFVEGTKIDMVESYQSVLDAAP